MKNKPDSPSKFYAKKGGFLIVSIWTAVAIGAVCCVGITSKAHKITIREMRDRVVTETIRRSKEIGTDFKNVIKTNLSLCGNITCRGVAFGRSLIRRNAPRAKKTKRLQAKQKCIAPHKQEEDSAMVLDENYVNTWMKSIETIVFWNLNPQDNPFIRKAHEDFLKACFQLGKKGLIQ